MHGRDIADSWQSSYEVRQVRRPLFCGPGAQRPRTRLNACPEATQRNLALIAPHEAARVGVASDSNTCTRPFQVSAT